MIIRWKLCASREKKSMRINFDHGKESTVPALAPPWTCQDFHLAMVPLLHVHQAKKMVRFPLRCYVFYVVLLAPLRKRLLNGARTSLDRLLPSMQIVSLPQSRFTIRRQPRMLPQDVHVVCRPDLLVWTRVLSSGGLRQNFTKGTVSAADLRRHQDRT